MGATETELSTRILPRGIHHHGNHEHARAERCRQDGEVELTDLAGEVRLEGDESARSLNERWAGRGIEQSRQEVGERLDSG